VLRFDQAFVVAVLCAATSARADDDPGNVTVGAYIEAFYSLNARLPSNHITNLRGFDNRDRTFTLSNVALDTKGERGPLSARLILQVGATPSTYYLAEPALAGTNGANASDAELWKYVQQATLAYSASSGLVVDAGLFPSPIGPEVLAVKDNWNWSRSDLFFGLPFYHTGARVAYPLGAGWTAMLHVYNGWNSVVDSNDYPSVAASAAFAGERLTGQVLYFGGIERPPGAPEGNAWRHLLDAYATITINDQVSLLIHADTGVEPNDIGTSAWVAAAAYAKVQLSSKLYGAVRGDYFREWVASDTATRASPIFWPADWISSLTATVAYQPIAGLSVRLEARHDHADARVFFGGDVTGDGDTVPYEPNRRAQDTLTLGVTGWF
jgi:hypothetical protein